MGKGLKKLFWFGSVHGLSEKDSKPIQKCTLVWATMSLWPRGLFLCLPIERALPKTGNAIISRHVSSLKSPFPEISNSHQIRKFQVCWGNFSKAT